MQDIPTTLHAKLCEHSYTLNSKGDIMVFCNNCGTENPDDVKFCSNCGTALKSISDEAAAIFDKDRERDYEPASTPRPTETLEGKEVKKLTLGGILGWICGLIFGLLGLAWVIASDFIAGISLLVISAVLLPPVNRLFREKMNLKLSAGLKVVVIVICLITFSMTVETDTTPASTPDKTPAVTSTPTQPEAPPPVDKDLIAKSASDMTLTIDDMPLGWVGNPGDGNDTYYHSTFVHSRDLSTRVSCTTTKYTTVNEAKQVFLELKQKCNYIKTVSVKLGDESTGYERYPCSHVIFRKANVIVHVDCFETYGSSTVRDAKEYAKKVETRVN